MSRPNIAPVPLLASPRGRGGTGVLEPLSASSPSERVPLSGGGAGGRPGSAQRAAALLRQSDGGRGGGRAPALRTVGRVAALSTQPRAGRPRPRPSLRNTTPPRPSRQLSDLARSRLQQTAAQPAHGSSYQVVDDPDPETQQWAEPAPILAGRPAADRGRGAEAAAPPPPPASGGVGVERLELALHRLNAVLNVGSGQSAMSSAADAIEGAVYKLAESAGMDPEHDDDHHIGPSPEQLGMIMASLPPEFPLAKIEHLGFLNALGRAMKLVTYNSRDLIVTKGDNSHSAYFIMQGGCEVLSELNKGTTPLAHLGSGDSFGERSLFSDDVRTASVVATDDGTEIFLLTRAALQRLLQRFPSVADDVETLVETYSFGGSVMAGFTCLSADTVRRLQDLFTGADVDGNGELSQAEIAKLLKMMGVVTSPAELEVIMQVMDEDQSGTVDIEEWVRAIDYRMGDMDITQQKELLQKIHSSKTGYAGTSWRKQANVIWMMNNGVMIMTFSVILVGLIYFQFILVPMTVAYFFTYVLGPINDLFYQRPLLCGPTCCYDEKTQGWQDEHGVWHEGEKPKRSCCKVGKSGNLWEDGDTPLGCKGFAGAQRTLADIFFLFRLPDALALLMTLVVAFGSFGLLSYGVYDQISTLVSTPIGETDEDGNVCTGQGINNEEDCDTKFIISLQSKRDDLRHTLLHEHHIVFDDIEPQNISIHNPTHVNMTSLEEDYGGVFAALNEFILILLLCLYMLSTRSMRTVDDKMLEQTSPHEMSLQQKIEASIRHYVILKSEISGLTGIMVMLTLMFLQVKLWLVWGILTFVLNFIPNVGSVIAMFVPMPVVIADDSLENWQKALAFLIPATIQGYVGNVLEPSLFGKSLNLTDISVLATLVIWYSLWGIYGAILSVPLLGVFKLLMDAADFPLAKMVLHVIRADNSIDEGLERTRTGGLDNLKFLPDDEEDEEERKKKQERAERSRKQQQQQQQLDHF
jgi:predicted PurR-regulated permease PerM